MADILYLETDRQLARNASAFFGRAGHRLGHFSDLQKAVTAIDQSRPDLIIIDLFLAMRSGIEFLFEVRSYPEWKRIPVIITGNLSSNDIIDYKAAFKELGVNSYIQKSASSLQKLLAAAESLLQPVRT
jgi:DNA-binding response OmpR family regulator